MINGRSARAASGIPREILQLFRTLIGRGKSSNQNKPPTLPAQSSWLRRRRTHPPRMRLTNTAMTGGEGVSMGVGKADRRKISESSARGAR